MNGTTLNMPFSDHFRYTGICSSGTILYFYEEMTVEMEI